MSENQAAAAPDARALPGARLGPGWVRARAGRWLRGRWKKQTRVCLAKGSAIRHCWLLGVGRGVERCGAPRGAGTWGVGCTDCVQT